MKSRTGGRGHGGRRLLGHAELPLSGVRTEADLALPAGADRLVVDPWARLPRFGGEVEAALSDRSAGTRR